MEYCYYFDVTSYGKFFTLKITDPKAGAFKIVKRSSCSENQDVPYEKNIHMVLSKRAKGDKQTYLEECRNSFLDKLDFNNLKRSHVKKMFSALISLFEKGHHAPYPFRTIEFFANTTYPMVFKKQR